MEIENVLKFYESGKNTDFVSELGPFTCGAE